MVPAPTQMASIPMPTSRRVSTRPNKGQTSKYDDFVEQLNLEPGNYMTDDKTLFRMEETGTPAINMSYVPHPYQTWPLHTAHIQNITTRQPGPPTTGTPT